MTTTKTVMSLEQLDYMIARFQGCGEGLREALSMVKTLRDHPAPSEKGAAALLVLEVLESELRGREEGNHAGYQRAVRERDARIYPDRGGDPDGDSYAGRDF